MKTFKEFKKDLCEAIDGFRVAKGLSKLELSKKSNKCPSYIVSLTLGHTSPTVRTLYEVAEAMDADLTIELRARRNV